VALPGTPVGSRTRAFVQLTQRRSSSTLRLAERSSHCAPRNVVDEDRSHAILYPAPPSLRPALAPGSLGPTRRPTPGRVAHGRGPPAGVRRAPRPLRRYDRRRLHPGDPVVDVAVAMPQPGALRRGGGPAHLGVARGPEAAAVVGGYRHLLPRPRQ